MKVLEADRVTRLYVEFNEQETLRLKQLRVIRPEALSPARLRLTLQEIADMQERGEIAVGTFEALPMTVQVTAAGELALTVDEKVIPVRDGDIVGRVEPIAEA